MFDSALPKDRGPIHNIITNPNRIFYRDPQYSISSRPINQHTLPSPLMLDSRIVNNSKFQDGFIVATNKSTASKAYHIDPKYRTRPLNQYALPPPNMKRVNFLTMNSAKTDTTTDLKQKPTFQLYVQIIRQIYKRMADDITASDQTVLNNAFESFQKEYVNKKNNMNDVQLDNMINNFISRVKEVFMRWYDTSDKSFNPVLTLESGTVLEEITTNNDELIETLKNRDNLEDNIKAFEAEAEMQNIQDAIDQLEKEKEDREIQILALIDADEKKLDIERQKEQKIKDDIAEQERLLDEADDLIASEAKQKTANDDRKVEIDTRLAEVKEEFRKTSSITSKDGKRKTARAALTKESDDLEAEKLAIDNGYAPSEQKVRDIEARKVVIEREQKDKEKANKDQEALIKAQEETDAKETKRLRDADAKEQKRADAELEARIEPVLKGLARFNAERTAKNALIEKVEIIKDKMTDTRLKDVYDALPKEFRNPEDPELDIRYREAVRKVFLEKDGVKIANDKRYHIYKNNYDRFKTLVTDNFRPNDLNKDIFDAIKGNDANKIDEKLFKTEFNKIIGSDPQKSDLSRYKTYALNRITKTPTKSMSITTKGKVKGKGSGRQKLSKSLKDLLKKYNF